MREGWEVNFFFRTPLSPPYSCVLGTIRFDKRIRHVNQESRTRLDWILFKETEPMDGRRKSSPDRSVDFRCKT